MKKLGEHLLPLLVFFALTGSIYPVETAMAEVTSIGEVDFSISCSDDAQAKFERGLALLHHMMYGQDSLGISANRFRSLYGAGRAAQLAGRTETADGSGPDLSEKQIDNNLK